VTDDPVATLDPNDLAEKNEQAAVIGWPVSLYKHAREDSNL